MKKMLAGLGFSVVIASGLFANSLMMATTTSTEDTGLLDSLFPVDQKRTLLALGLHKISQVVEVDDNPSIRGMIRKVHHLVTVVE